MNSFSLRKIILSNIRLIVAVQAALLVILAVLVVYKGRNADPIYIDSQYIQAYPTVQNSEGYYYINDSDTDSEDWIDILTGTAFLKAGSYTLYIDYRSTCDRPFSINDSTPNGSYLRGNKGGMLRAHNTREMFKFHTDVDLTDPDVGKPRLFTVGIKSRFDENGSMTLQGITIVPNNETYKRMFSLALVLFVIFDLLFYYLAFGKNRRKELLVVLGVCGVAFLASLPMTLNGIAEGHDIQFQLMRMETLYQDLKNGAFPVRINSSAIRDMGYPVSIFYGDIFLYPFALMRLAGFTVMEAWKALIFTVNILTAATCYVCFKKMNENRYYALCMTSLYVLAPYRLTNIYIRAAAGEFIAASFLPIVALAVYRIYTQKQDRKSIRTNSSLLAFALAAILCSHILSCEMITVLLLIHGLVFYRITFTKDVMSAIIRTIGKTIVFSAYFTVPFIDVFLNDPLRISDTVANTTKHIQARGIVFSDIFSITHSEFVDRYPLTPGIILVISLLTAYICLLKRIIKGRALKYCIFMSTVLLFAASRYFPWNILADRSFIFNALAQIQFPFRLLTPAVLFLTLMSGYLYRQKVPVNSIRLFTVIILISGIVTASLFTETYERERQDIITYTNTSEVDSRSVGGGEYLRLNTNLHNTDAMDELKQAIYQVNADLVSSYDLTGTGIVMDCHGPDLPSEILVPKFNYKGYHAYDEEGNEYEIKDGLFDLISVTLPAGYSGKIYLRYIEPAYWRFAEAVSLISLIILFVSCAAANRRVILFPLTQIRLIDGFIREQKKKKRKTAGKPRTVFRPRIVELSVYYIVLTLLVFLTFALKWTMENFSMVTFSGILFTLRMPFSDAGSDIINGFIKSAVVPTILFIVLAVMIILALNRKEYIDKLPYKPIRIILPVISVVWLAVILSGFDRKFEVVSYLKSQTKKSQFIETEYVDPGEVRLSFPEHKRNLIYIFLESAETSLIDKNSGGILSDHNYIPEMTKLLDENIDFSQNDLHRGAAVSPSSGWTVAGILAEHGGLPLKLYEQNREIDNSMNMYKYFMPGATMLGDILEEEGYRNYFMCGSDIEFGGRKTMFEQHGNYEIFDLNTARSEGKISPTYFVWWGFEDMKLYEYAKEKITELSEDTGHPFNFTFLTVDTHHPDGYMCPLCDTADCEEQYGQVWHCASRQVYSFVEWCKAQPWYDDTTIVICGDHCSMDVNFFENYKYDRHSGETTRTVYNCYINSPVKPVKNTNRLFTTMDLFPTTLAAMGVEIEGDRLALGTNLFSDSETLSEKYGYEKLFEEIESRSDFYDNKLLYP